MNQRRARRSGFFRRLWRWILNPDAAIADTSNDLPTRMLTREEQRAFDREQRWWAWGIVTTLVLAVAVPLVFLVVEMFDGIETRERAAREANYIPPR